MNGGAHDIATESSYTHHTCHHRRRREGGQTRTGGRESRRGIVIEWREGRKDALLRPRARPAGCLWPPYQRFAEEPICGHLSPSRFLAEFEQLLRWIPRPTSVTPLPGGWRVDSRGPLVSKDYRVLVSYFAFFCIH